MLSGVAARPAQVWRRSAVHRWDLVSNAETRFYVVRAPSEGDYEETLWRARDLLPETITYGA